MDEKGFIKELIKMPHEMYMLDEENNVIVTDDWTKFLEFLNEERNIIKQDKSGDILISTVFLNFNHGFFDDPKLFETMVFGADEDEICLRASTYEQALENHESMKDEYLKQLKPLLCLDFDGVLHSYTSGWLGIDVITDAPVYGANEFVNEALEQFEVAVFSARSSSGEGIEAMKKWLRKWHFPVQKMSFPKTKPPAFLTIDDRAMLFDGNFPKIDEIRQFVPWMLKKR